MQPIFRQKALDRLTLPEQLDQLLHVTTPQGWIVLLGLNIVLLLAFYWMVFERIPVTVMGQGVLVADGGLRSITAVAPGQVETVAVQTGDQVEAGQVLATVHTNGAEPVAVVSPLTGRVVDILAAAGTQVERGSPLLLIEPADAPLQALVYVPFAQGKTLVPGMQARLAVATVPPAQAGYLLGEVETVASFPATATGMRSTLGNETLIESFLAYGPQIEVRIRLLRRTDNTGGYQWTLPQETSATVGSGTPCTASIVVDEQRPMQFIFSGAAVPNGSRTAD